MVLRKKKKKEENNDGGRDDDNNKEERGKKEEELNAEKSPFQRTYATQAATKVLARQLVRLTQQIANLQGSRAQMRGIATHTLFVELVKSMDSVCCLLEPGKQLFTAAFVELVKSMDSVCCLLEPGKQLFTAAVEEETGIKFKLEDMVDLTAFLDSSTGCRFFPSPASIGMDNLNA
ncbi:vacuolar protein sorting-associated protein 2 homolog 3-like [Arachis duranensis]|uniref:Vacuolar protein sorting-associated protein 2 homolog 3-like n=1 Tax=Arachis duranensis TaxID=130453 RepID=A0A9C6WFW4_ARADU|nr:vacuolar protein sorting-associated protein 2 homolog 3-like [Arachis duranensis]